MKKSTILFCLMVFWSSLFSQTIEEEINKLAGVFVGEWTAYKLDKDHVAIKALSWKDTLITDEPTINDSLAFVNISSTMVFDNPKMPEYKMNFQEGMKIDNGKIKSHFFTVMGNETIETKIGDNTYIISQAIAPYELKQLGIDEEATGINTTVKVILIENEIEIHKITRLSTITFASDLNLQAIQFVSLKGYHRRIEN